MRTEIPFDAIVTLFVFLVGVPAVVLQTLAPEIRQVLAKRAGQLLVDAVIPFLLAAALLAGGVALDRAGVWDGQTAWSAVLGATLVIGVLSAVRVVRKYGRRDAVVRQLEREAGRRLERSGRLVEEPLRDLIELGKQSEPGREREWVLESLRRLADRTCSHPSYSGDRLEDLISGVIESLVGAPETPHHENFSTAVALMRRALRGLDTARSQDFKDADTLHAIYGLSRLQRAALSLPSDDIPLRMVQALAVTASRHPATTTAASQVLFEMGVAAIGRDRFLVAMSALGSLMTLVERNTPAEGELVADVLGLLGHFWAHGEAARELARQRLALLQPWLKQDLLAALETAIEHSAQRALFRTADHVRRIRRELHPDGEHR